MRASTVRVLTELLVADQEPTQIHRWVFVGSHRAEDKRENAHPFHEIWDAAGFL